MIRIGRRKRETVNWRPFEQKNPDSYWMLKKIDESSGILKAQKLPKSKKYSRGHNP